MYADRLLASSPQCMQKTPWKIVLSVCRRLLENSPQCMQIHKPLSCCSQSYCSSQCMHINLHAGLTTCNYTGYLHCLTWSVKWHMHVWWLLSIKLQLSDLKWDRYMLCVGAIEYCSVSLYSILPPTWSYWYPLPPLADIAAALFMCCVGGLWVLQ